MKGMGDFMKEPTPEETAIWQKTVDDSYEQFLSVVKEGRAYYRGEEGEAAKPTRERLAGVKVETVDETASESSDAEAPAAEETTEVPSEESTEETVEVVETTDAQVELSLKDARDAELRKLADGRIYSAADAKELRLIDEIGFLDDAIDAAIELAKLSKEEVEVVRYEEEAGLFDGLLGSVKSKEEPLNKAMKTFSTPKGYYICPRVLP